MSNTIDEKVVEAKFDNKQFLAAVTETIAALDKLKGSLKLEGATAGFENLNTVSSKFNLNNMLSSTTQAVTNFGRLSGAAVTAFADIGTKAINAGNFVMTAFGRPITPITPKLDTAPLQTGTEQSISMIDRLKSALSLKGATQGLESVSTAASRLNLEHVSSAVDQIGSHFTALGAMAAGVFATIGNQAVRLGERLGKSLTTPVRSGFGEYELKMGSIQTILANTARYNTPLSTVNAELNKLNTYADKTIYDFGEMTKNASLFTNSGMKIEDATTVIKGFSNAAAASGTSAEGAAGAAYQLSQALSAGQIRLMDWRSLTNVGMGGKNMQQSIIQIAEAMGTLKKGSDTAKLATTDFNASLEKKWLTADVMSKYLKVMSGDMSVAQIQSIGLGKAAAEALKKQSTTALDAATKVRTFTQLIGTLKEAVGSGWTDSFELIFGNFTQATNLFTSVNNVLSGIVGKSAQSRNHILHVWQELGGRTAIIESIKNVFNALVAVINPIKDAFREIFPAKTGQDLVRISKEIQEFTSHLKIGGDTADKLKRTFAGFFAIFDIAKQVLGGAASAVLDLFRAFSGGGKSTGGFLTLTSSIGDFLVYYDKLLRSSNGVKDFFNNLEKPIQFVLGPINLLISAFSRLFKGFDISGPAKGFETGMQRVGDRMSPLAALGRGIISIFRALGRVLGDVGKFIGNIGENIGKAISSAFTPETFSKSLDVINTALFGGIVLLMKNFMKSGVKVDIGGGVFSGMRTALGTVTETMKSMQQQIKADTILKIAAALALLTASIVVLAMINGKDLAKAMTGLGVGLLGLQISLVSMSKAVGMFGAVQAYVLAAAISKLAMAMLLMAFAIKVMSTIPFADMIKGILGFAGVLFVIGQTMKLMPKGMGGQATALILLGVAMNLLALALKVFATMSWEQMAHGMAGLAGALVIIAGAMRLMPKDMVFQAGALILLSVALNAIAASLIIFSTISWESMEHGMTALAGSLLIIAAALRLMPNGANMLLQGVALNAVATALIVLSGALMIMGNMSWEEIGKGLVTLAGSLLILSVALNSMTGALPGAAALLIATAALAILVPLMITMGAMSWESILKSLTELAGIFVVLGLAGLVLAPLVPVLLGLGAAMVLIGAGLTLAGAGAFLFATAFGIVVATGTAGIRVFQQILASMVMAIPLALVAFGQGIIKLALVIAKAAPEFTQAFIAVMTAILTAIATTAPKIALTFLTILNSLLDVVIKIAPKLGLAFLSLMNVALIVLELAIPRMAQAGLNLINSLLRAVASKIGDIVKNATDLVVNFIDAMSKSLPRIIDSGVKFIIAFINGVSDAIDKHSKEMGEAGGRLAVAIVKGMADGIEGGLSVVTDAAKHLAHKALDAAKGILGIHSPSKEFEKIGAYVNDGFAKGLEGNRDSVLAAYQTTQDLLSAAIKSSADDIVSAQQKLKDLTASREKDSFAIKQGTIDLGQAKEKLTEAKNEHAAYASSLAAANQQYKNAKAHLDNVTHSTGNYSGSVADATAKNRAAKHTLDDLEAAHDKNKDAIDRARLAYKRTSETLHDVTAARGKDSAEVKKAQSDFDKAQKNVQKIQKDHKQNLDDLVSTQQAYDKAKQHLSDLTAARDKDTQAIADATAALAEAQAENQKATDAQTLLTSERDTEVEQLATLGDAYEAYTKQIDDANSVLADAIKTRDDFDKQIHDQYDTFPTLSKDTELTTYLTDLEQKINDTQSFAVAIQRLRDLGLSDEMYKELLSKGVDALPFVNELLSGGEASVTQINTLSGELDTAAKSLGDTASTTLYQSGVDAAQGLVDGLKAKQSDIADQMRQIAESMIAALNDSLQIKSPSRIFMKAGVFTGQGLAVGLSQSTGLVEEASATLGANAISALQKSLMDMSTAVDGNLNLQPTITPILDLTSVQKGALALNGMLPSQQIAVDTSYSTATDASKGYADNQAAAQDLRSSAAESVAPNVTFVQNNTSPKALSSAEIYRQTNSQISKAKGVLTNA